MIVVLLLLSGTLSLPYSSEAPSVCACQLGEGAFRTVPRPADPPAAPLGAVDTDGDGLSDADELIVGTDPLRVDSDCDAETDWWEVGSDPTNAPDADDDGLPDALEHPLADHDFDGITDEEDKGSGWQLLCSGIKPWAVKDDGSETATIEVAFVRHAGIVSVSLRSEDDLAGLWLDGNALGSGSTVQLYDDGTHGDATAGDGRFTRTGLTAGTTGVAVTEYRFDLLELVDGNGPQTVDLDALLPTTVYRQLAVGIVDAARVEPLATVASGFHVGRHLVNFVDPIEAADVHRLMVFHALGFLGAGTSRFYEQFPDVFDAVMLFPDVPGNLAIRGRHMPVRNDVSGLGLGTFDEGSFWGSDDRLESVLLRAFDASGPNMHEWMHRWANWVDSPELGFWTCGNGGHWGWNAVYGILGGFEESSLIDLGGGVFHVPPFGPGGYATDSIPLADIELYLAGLLPAGQAAGTLTFPDIDCGTPPVCADEECTLWEFHGGVPRTTSIADVVAEVGPRIPDASAARKDFNLGALIVSSVPLTPTEMAFYDYQLERFGGPGDGASPFSFGEMTRGLGSIETAVAAYRVYRGAEPQTASAPANLLGATLLPGFDEPAASATTLTFYRIEEGPLDEADIRLSLLPGDTVRIDW